MLYERCVCIVEIPIRSRQAMTVGKPASLLSVSFRTACSDLDTVDKWLGEFSHKPVMRIPGIGIPLKDISGQIQIHLREKGTGGCVISPAERICSIVGWPLSEGSSIDVVEMAERLQVSAATVFDDLQKVKAWMDQSYIHMVSKPYMGIMMRDAEDNIRRRRIMALREMLEMGAYQQELIGMRFTQAESLLRKYRMTFSCNVLDTWRRKILLIAREFQDSTYVTISDNGFCAAFLYFPTAFTRMDRGYPINAKRQTFPHIEVPFGFNYNRVHDMILDQTGLDVDESEMLLIHTEWVSPHKLGSSQEVNVEYVLTAKEPVAEVKDSLEIEFEEGDDTVLDLAAHPSAMQYRLFLNIPMGHNVVLQEIGETFPGVCQVVRQKLCVILKE